MSFREPRARARRRPPLRPHCSAHCLLGALPPLPPTALLGALPPSSRLGAVHLDVPVEKLQVRAFHHAEGEHHRPFVFPTFEANELRWADVAAHHRACAVRAAFLLARDCLRPRRARCCGRRFCPRPASARREMARPPPGRPPPLRRAIAAQHRGITSPFRRKIGDLGAHGGRGPLPSRAEQK